MENYDEGVEEVSRLE
jgi:hypothetical protein